jgi:predicted nucleic acid-binding protein
MGSSVMADQPRVYLDANVFIAAFENRGAHGDHAWWILEAVESGTILAATSEMSLAEVLVKPLEQGDEALAEAYESMIVSGEGFEVLQVRRDILLEAARTRAGRSAIKLPDAIHIATARAASCDYVVSDDRRMPVTKGIKVIPLTPFTLDEILGEAP